MVYIKSYKDLIVWQKAMELAKAVFELTSYFPRSELYGLIAQMRKAVVSVVSNIAEGYGRRSPREYSQFYAIAYGSALELETQLMLSKSLKMALEERFKICDDLLLEVLKMLHSMIIKLDARR